jgi:hypothetical protein
MASPTPASPPPKAVESFGNNGYFARDIAKKGLESRRGSISLGTKELHISSGSENEEAITGGTVDSEDALGIGLQSTPGRDGQRGVIRRAVTRRSNMFASILFYYLI